MGLTSLTDLVRKDLAICGTKENMVRVAALKPIKVQNIEITWHQGTLSLKGFLDSRDGKCPLLLGLGKLPLLMT